MDCDCAAFAGLFVVGCCTTDVDVVGCLSSQNHANVEVSEVLC
jgi:hypothetical protein